MNFDTQYQIIARILFFAAQLNPTFLTLEDIRQEWPIKDQWCSQLFLTGVEVGERGRHFSRGQDPQKVIVFDQFVQPWKMPIFSWFHSKLGRGKIFTRGGGELPPKPLHGYATVKDPVACINLHSSEQSRQASPKERCGYHDWCWKRLIALHSTFSHCRSFCLFVCLFVCFLEGKVHIYHIFYITA